jgi:phosphoglycolate phosphatase-like HAD superfamily hydrolase
VSQDRRLVLFDIDGTLLSAGGVFRRALSEALVEAFGTTGALEDYDFSGKTDPQIFRELMRGAGFSDAEIDRRMASALDGYRVRLEAFMRPEDVTAKAGVFPLLDRLAADTRACLGLLTGNLEACARVKLAPLGVNQRFPFGAYGSDHEDRHRLPAVAVERAFEATGHRFGGKSIVIVGDSIHDVRCGRRLGVRALAVASGRTTRAALAAESPDALFDDLADTAAVLRAILD